jgi:hypothetical protein
MAKSRMQLSPSNRPENVPCHHIVAIAPLLTAPQHPCHAGLALLMHSKCSVELRERDEVPAVRGCCSGSRLASDTH